MDKIERTLIEEYLYRGPGNMVNKRGTVLSAEFAPRLIVHGDGTEDDGTVLTSALAYLDAHHTLRLSVWDVLGDALLREVVTTTAVAARPFSVRAFDRSDMVHWYSKDTEYEDVGAFLSPYRPACSTR